MCAGAPELAAPVPANGELLRHAAALLLLGLGPRQPAPRLGQLQPDVGVDVGGGEQLAVHSLLPAHHARQHARSVISTSTKDLFGNWELGPLNKSRKHILGK